MRRVVAVFALFLSLGLVGGVPVAVPTSAASAGCPDARTCDVFEYLVLQHGRPVVWAPDPDGITRIPYWINPVQPWLPEEEALAAVRAAFGTWDAVLPGVRFEYQGTTVRPPLPLDGMNVVGWFAPYGVGAAHATFTAIDGYILEADITLGLHYRWAWFPCEQKNNSCTNLTREEVGSSVDTLDVQNVVTHEVGHWLNLKDLYGPETKQLTMSGHRDDGELGYRVYRHKVTLGLGDTLGARSMYPCGCPLPPIYYP